MTTDEPPRVVIVAPTLDYGYLYWRGLFDAIHSIGIPPKVLTTSPLSGEPYLGPRIHHYRLRFRQRNNVHDRLIVLTSPELIWWIVRNRPDYVLAVEYSLATFWSVLGSRLVGAKLIIFQEHLVETTRLRELWREGLRRLSDHIVANTTGAYQSLIGTTDASKVSEIAMLVPPEATWTGHDVQRTPGDNHVTTFLCVGRLVEGKNISRLLDAVKIVKESGCSFQTVIVGNGELREALLQKAKDIGVDGHVVFAGMIPYDNMADYYRGCDVFILPTLRDYRSVAVLEAMRYGKAIIDSSEDGNAGDSVVNGRNGLIVNPYDVSSIAQAMLALIANPDKVRRMGAESLAYMERRTPEIAAREFRALLDRLR